MIAHLWNEAGELPDDESESSCACQASGAYECYARQTGGAALDPFRELHDDEDAECECACHQRDQDGFTAWQDEAERKAILAQEEKDRLASIAKCGVG